MRAKDRKQKRNYAPEGRMSALWTYLAVKPGFQVIVYLELEIIGRMEDE
jgi:hypothetical protein